MKKPRYVVGVIGADLIGREVVSALEERLFPVEALRIFDDAEALGEAVDFGGGEVPVEVIEAGVRGIDIALLAREQPLDDAGARCVLDSGAILIDCGGQYALDRAVPLIVPECNAAALAGYSARRIVSSPDPLAVALSVALTPLHRRAGLRRAVVTSLEAACGAGAAGIDELSRQTVEVLNGRSVEAAVFPGRLCFNVLPWVGGRGAGDDAPLEECAAAHVRKVLGGDAIELSITRVCVPIFYGIGMTVNVELCESLTSAAAREILRESPGVLLAEDDGTEVVTVADAVGQDATVVSRLRADQSVENGLNFWAAIDSLRKGRAVNAVQIAEILIRDYL